MHLGWIRQNRILMNFRYWRLADGGEELVARGEQQVACMQREGSHLLPCPMPQELHDALSGYAANGPAT